MQNCRSQSIVIESKIAQTIEQGMGRAVRGEKDYSAVVLIGTDLVRFVNASKSRSLFSLQMRTQIEIGLEVSEMAKEDFDVSKEAINTFKDLINQLLKRDDGWKDFYVEKMNEMGADTNHNKSPLSILLLEKQSEDAILSKNHRKAVACLQKIVDIDNMPDDEKGWYLQEMARILYLNSKTESNQLQIAAHRKNRLLLRPQEGMNFVKLEKLSCKRIEKICDWIKDCGSYNDLQLCIQEILSSLSFGTQATKFEKALDELGSAIGFETQQPDKEWKEGPDNLWLVEDNKYFLFECKSEVDLDRAEITKTETGQMNNSIAWFNKVYGYSSLKCFQIIPTKTIARAAGYNGDVFIIREKGLRRLVSNVRSFFREFEKMIFEDLSIEHINGLLSTHKLTVSDFEDEYYSEKPK